MLLLESLPRHAFRTDPAMMHRPVSASYAFAGGPAPGFRPAIVPSVQQTSAQSPSAHPDEDWTKISDLAERRRIQNRIAQRNYRKKLKRRLEDLERRAGSSSPSPERASAEPSPERRRPQPAAAASAPTRRGAARSNTTTAVPTARAQLLSARDDLCVAGATLPRPLSMSPPPSFTFDCSLAEIHTTPSSYSPPQQALTYPHPLPAPPCSDVAAPPSHLSGPPVSQSTMPLTLPTPAPHQTTSLEPLPLKSQVGHLEPCYPDYSYSAGYPTVDASQSIPQQPIYADPLGYPTDYSYGLHHS